MTDLWAAQRTTRLTTAEVPISWAAQAAVEYVIDHCPARFEDLEKLLAQVMHLKEARILNPPPWGSWADFTKDVLDQITEGTGYGNASLIQQVQDEYWLTPEFIEGNKYNIFPEENEAVYIIPRGRQAREEADSNARHLMVVRSVYGELDRLTKVINDEDADQYARIALEQVMKYAHKYFPDAIKRLSPPEEKPRKRMPVRTLADLPPKPAAKEVARAKYGLDGMPHSPKVVNIFGIDGKRECAGTPKQPGCGKRRLPEDFEVYTDGKKAGWFLRPHCRDCMSKMKTKK